MKRENETIKIAIWVGCGLLIGALSMFAVQHFSSGQQQTTAGAKQETPGEMNTSQSETSSTLQANTGSQSANPSGQQMQVCPYPVSSALATLNGSAGVNGSQTDSMPATYLAPGTSVSESSSGYPIYTGGRAVDSPPVLIESSSGYMAAEAAPQASGRNGLLANPCSDPPSAHGLAYGRSY